MEYKILMNSRSEIIKLINRIEGLYPVNNWKAYGICIWPIVRFSIYAKLWTKNHNTYKKNNSYKFIKMWDFVRNFYKNLARNDEDHSYALFLNNAGCRREVDGIWFDVFTDPIRNVLADNGYSSITYEWENTKYCSPIYSDSVRFQSNLNIIKIKAKFKAIQKKATFPFFDEINDKVGNVLDLGELYYQVELIHESYMFFLEHIRKIKPSIAFSTIYYNEISMGFILACKKEGVLSIDIQHGMQVGNNPAYSFWRSLSEDSYDLLPDVFLVRGMAEKDNIEKWLKKGNVIISGDLWLNFWKNNNEALVIKYDSMIASQKKYNKKYILYTLDYENIPEVMKNIIRKTSSEYYWCIRLHPDDLKNIDTRYKELSELLEFVEIKYSSTWPLHAWLRNVDIHITEYSGVVYEAEEFGVPSVIVSKREAGLFSDVISRGNAVVADDEASIIQAMKKMKKCAYKKNINNLFLDELLQLISTKQV